MLGPFVQLEDLQQLTGYERMADVERCLRAQGIRYSHGLHSPLWTTLEWIHEAAGLKSSSATEAPVIPLIRRMPAIVRKAIISKEEIMRWAVPVDDPNSALPGGAGVYFLIDAREIFYIGQSVEIGTRVRQHALSGRQFSQISWVTPIPHDALDEIEAFYITALRPAENVRRPSPTLISRKVVRDYLRGQLPEGCQ